MRQDRHRTAKRQIEAENVVSILKERFLATNEASLKVLEFGAGAGDQVPFLSKLGEVTAIDIYTHSRIDLNKVNFIECSVTDTPFESEQFDVIYSNHVIAHIGESRSHDLDDAFKEIQRIGKKDCLYAFAVPTSLWLLLAVPAQYFLLAKGVMKRLMPSKKSKVVLEGVESTDGGKKRSLISALLPKGLGTYSSFSSALFGFRKKAWRKLFEQHGFSNVGDFPLAVYGASEFPVVPTTTSFNGINIASSRLFVLKRQA